MKAAPVPQFGTAELIAGGTRITIVPALGGKIISMRFGDREWLWSDPRAPLGTGSAESGGLVEYFPTAEACTLPAITGRYAVLHMPGAYSGLTLPASGELGAQRATFALETREEGVFATCGWVGERMPYRFARALHVTHDGRVVMRYGVSNDGLDRLPYVWCSQPWLPLTKETRLELDDAARLRVWRQHGVEFGGPGAEHRWPRIASGGKLFDLAHPFALARRYACRLFVDAPSGRASIVEAGARLTLTFDKQSPSIALWINRQGWSPSRKVKPPMHLAIGPSSGGPDALTEALGGWKSAAWLEPGETREWTVGWSAGPAA